MFVIYLKEFHRYEDSTTVDRHKLEVPVSVRYVRFHPTQQHGWNCLRVEVYSVDSKLSTSSITFFSRELKLEFSRRQKKSWSSLSS